MSREHNKIARSLVSVVIPAYNRARLLSETLQALARQPYRPLEVIVVDDGSTDATPETVRRWLAAVSGDADIRVAFLEQPRKGAAAARNAGWRRATGRYLHFLDSDDVPGPCLYASLVAVLDAHPACAFAWGDWVEAEDAGPAAAALRAPDLSRVRSDCRPPNNAWCGLYRAEALPADLRWNETLVFHNDWDFTTRFLLHGPELLHLPAALLAYRTHRGSERLGRVRSSDSLEAVLRAVRETERRVDRRACHARTLRIRLSTEYGVLLYKALETGAPRRIREAARGVCRNATWRQSAYWLLVSLVLLLAIPIARTTPGAWVLRRVRRSFGDLQLVARNPQAGGDS